MKKMIRFFVAFGIILVAVYMKPVFFPQSLSKEPKQPTTPVILHKSVNHHELEATGFAKYVNENVNTLVEKYGDPKEILPTALGYDWWIYGENEKDYFQVGVKGEEVVTILTLGNDLEMSPFTIDMTLTNVSDLTTIYSNFSFQLEDTEYDLELTEEDMNYRPLIAFKNESFAILHFNQLNGKLLGIRYVNKAVLLRTMPYQLSAGESYPFSLNDDTDWEAVNRSNGQQMTHLINILRKKDGRKAYKMDRKLNEEASLALAKLEQAPASFISDSNILLEWEGQEDNPLYSHPIFLSSDVVSKLFSSNNGLAKTRHEILMRPAYDPAWTAMYWYGDLTHQRVLSHKKDRYIGVVFSKGTVVFLIQDEKTKETEVEKESETS